MVPQADHLLFFQRTMSAAHNCLYLQLQRPRKTTPNDKGHLSTHMCRQTHIDTQMHVNKIMIIENNYEKE